jgi:type III pantothenate kinase
MKKVLAIDIGNTNITFGLFKGAKLLRVRRLPTSDKINLLSYKPKLKNIDGVIICSVVPKVLKSLKASLKPMVDCKLLVVGENIDTGVINRYHYPKQVGQDRLVNARAAYEIYKRDCIIVDFGTAITIDIVNDKREYLGGAIAPGLEISLETLAQRTALLPRLKLAKPKNLIGQSTKDSILSGIFYGFASLTDGMIEKFKKKLRRNFLVIATGGHSPLIAPYCEKIDTVKPSLTLEGLRIIYHTSLP